MLDHKAQRSRGLLIGGLLVMLILGLALYRLDQPGGMDGLVEMTSPARP